MHSNKKVKLVVALNIIAPFALLMWALPIFLSWAKYMPIFGIATGTYTPWDAGWLALLLAYLVIRFVFSARTLFRTDSR